jgi:pimeloyl-ACP methyl ester carboxylesterase
MAETIVMIHGMWAGGWCWENYVDFFTRRGYRCTAPYLRHHHMGPLDKQPRGLGCTGLLDYAADLESAIKQLPEKPVIMGHSMGGLLAQILAARGLAKAAVLIAPASPWGIQSLTWTAIRCFAGPILQLKFLGFPHKLSFKAAVYSMLHLLPAAEQQTVWSRCAYESGRALREIGLWFADWNRASRVNEADVACPVLVICGSQDRMIPPCIVKKIAEKYQHVARYREFEHHAHCIIGETGWEQAAECIAGWLTEELKIQARKQEAE